VAQAVKAITNQSGESGSGEKLSRPRPAWLERLMEYPERAKKFWHEVRVEMGHVTWPPLAEVRSTTFVVIVTIFFFGVFFFVVDMGVSKVVELILKRGKL
jgi:preprotein translocase subunit SecE